MPYDLNRLEPRSLTESEIDQALQQLRRPETLTARLTDLLSEQLAAHQLIENLDDETLASVLGRSFFLDDFVERLADSVTAPDLVVRLIDTALAENLVRSQLAVRLTDSFTGVDLVGSFGEMIPWDNTEPPAPDTGPDDWQRAKTAAAEQPRQSAWAALDWTPVPRNFDEAAEAVFKGAPVGGFIGAMSSSIAATLGATGATLGAATGIGALVGAIIGAYLGILWARHKRTNENPDNSQDPDEEPENGPQ